MRIQSLLYAIAALLMLMLENVSMAGTTQIATLRLDYFHSGNAKTEHYALDRIVIEPLPWPGNPKKNLDNTNRGSHLFEVRDKQTGKLLYSRGFATVFGEWQSTDQANKLERGFQESLRFPKPDAPVSVHVLKRDNHNQFQLAWSIDVDPNAQQVIRHSAAPQFTPVLVHGDGKTQNKVDLLIIGDGYTKKEMTKFIRDAKRMSRYLFTVSPYKERSDDFNVWALAVPTLQTGISRPSTGQFHADSTGASYDIFGSERYVLTLDNRALREIAQNAPYEFIEILVNNETYGGGGIFGQFSTAAANSDWANYLFVHEFGHHFAALADEYYTSPVAYQTGADILVEPWEPNVTALKNPSQLKWRDLIQDGTAIPSSWPKERYEAIAREFQQTRAQLRKEQRPETEMSALFKKDLAETTELFSKDPNYNKIGAFEGANYEAKGYFRSQMQCLMFDRSEQFCQVCQNAIHNIIDLYSR
ncbi:M64 family metallopeptidase [Undibacterium fentianense]|uniref:Peptidase M64 n=1 Tax=Undibacterium fentianense TaxID=2828728 RepID=A0A941E6Z8_9BURK|nr:M64 family metallopeptidase [Undibacterium fentianense]MBR7801734.1 peptidase M64 [Undibacterium fentianense]